MQTIKSLPANLKRLIHGHPQAVVIWLTFILLATIYSLATPPFEAGDESRHYAVVKYMAETGRLPVQNVPQTGPYQLHWSHEGNQPPLYYALAALPAALIDADAWDQVFWYNPHTTIGNPLRPDNKNITIHPPTETWTGHVLAVHLIRFLSMAMAAITVAACYAIGLALFTGNRWLAAGAMAITAFNPMFIFISAAINNDNAVIMFITLALLLMAKALENPARFIKGRTPLLFAVLLGLVIGLGALSKLYALGLLPIAGLVIIWLGYHNEKFDTPSPAINLLTSSQFWRHVIGWGAVLGLVFLAVAGWFYLRNAQLYNGDLLALQVMREAAGQRREVPSLATVRAEFEGFRIAYWALFGGINILVDGWIYTVLDAFSLIAFVGFIAFGLIIIYVLLLKYFGKPDPHSARPVSRLIAAISLPVYSLLVGWSLIMVTGFIVWNITQPAGQGRLLYPAIAAISALALLGLSWWLPVKAQRITAGICILGLFTLAALAPFLYIIPAYQKPAILTETDIPDNLQRVDFVYDDTMRLLGYTLQTDAVRPAESLPLTLYWEILRPAKLDYSIFVHVLGRQHQVIGQIDTYPGGGHWPTSLLAPGDILADTYLVPIKPEAEFDHAPARLQIAAGIYNFHEPGRPGREARTLSGTPVDPIIATTKLIPWQWPDPALAESPIEFFDKATLISFQLADDQQSVTLNWRVNNRFDTDYTVFIQAWQADEGIYITGFDGPPVQGDYPTSLWSPGEIIIDTHAIDLSQLSPDTYRLIAGLYDPVTGTRLPAFGPDGPLPDAAVILGTLQVPK